MNLSTDEIKPLMIQSRSNHTISEHCCHGAQAFNTWDFGIHSRFKPYYFSPVLSVLLSLSYFPPMNPPLLLSLKLISSCSKSLEELPRFLISSFSSQTSTAGIWCYQYWKKLMPRSQRFYKQIGVKNTNLSNWSNMSKSFEANNRQFPWRKVLGEMLQRPLVS